jgi:L-2-hydroxyglutarate oxidase
LISAERLRDLEPHAAGVQAIHVPETGIVNFRRVCERLRDLITERGGRVTCGAKVQTIQRQGSEIVVGTREGSSFRARYLVNCGGLHCDRLAAAAQQSAPAKIVPFRGEYYELRPEARHLCRNLIYPVPDPNFPFLGVHFTRMIDGTVECGPNAVLAFAREGYCKTDIHFGDLWESLTYPGFQRLCRRYWRMGLGEMWRSFSKRAFVRALQRLIPTVRSDQLVAARAGVRAQAIAPDGSMVDDFLILEADRMIHVCNAPSPAATSALNIGKTVAEKLTAQFGTSPQPQR